MGFNQILLKKGKDLALPKEFQEFQETIQSSSQILLELINNILDLSKIEAGKMQIIVEDFYLEELIKKIFETYNFQAVQKGIIFTYEISPHLPPVIQSDRIKIPAAERSRLGSTFASRKRGIQHFKTL